MDIEERREYSAEAARPALLRESAHQLTDQYHPRERMDQSDRLR